MAKRLFEVGIGLADENIRYLSDNGIPINTLSQEARIGSMYMDIDTGNHYVKIKNGTSSEDWERTLKKKDLDPILAGLDWREHVVVMDSTEYANLAAAQTALSVADYTIDDVTLEAGDRILLSNLTTGPKNVYIVTGESLSYTLVEDSNTVNVGDTVYIAEGAAAGKQYTYGSNDQWNWTGAPDGSEQGWMNDFIGKVKGNDKTNYSSNHYVEDETSLETAIGKLDSTFGEAPTGVHGNIFPQPVNDNLHALDQKIGTFQPGSSGITVQPTISENLNALDAEIGVSPTDTHYAIGDTVYSNIKLLDTAIYQSNNKSNENLRQVFRSFSESGVMTTAGAPKLVDSIPVSSCAAAEYTVVVTCASESKRTFGKILATHDKFSSGGFSASEVDYNSYGVVRFGGAIPGLKISVKLSTDLAAMELLVESPSAAVDIRVTRTLVFESIPVHLQN